jgi:hypothetical protein
MRMSPPMLACTLQARIPVELEALYQRSRTDVSDADKFLGIELLTDAYFDLIDTCFVRIIEKIGSSTHSKELSDAHKTIDEVKNKARHYLHWIAGYLANDRIPPVIAHFHAMTQQDDDGRAYMAFKLSDGLAAEIKRVVAILADGHADNFDDGSALIIKVIEEAMVPLAIEPKNLMKFNFVVDKTLNGVIALVEMLLKRMLHKLSPKIPREIYPEIAAHLQTFLIV